MLCNKKLALAACTIIIALFTTFSTSAAADDNRFDIVGIRLGMSPEQVLQALKTYGLSGTDIHETRLAFGYSDGVNHGFKTDDFLARLTAGKVEQVGNRRRNDSFELFFSPPPAGGKLVAVRRLLGNGVDPITGGQFRQALLDKYGKPSASVSGKLHWKFGGGDMNCLSTNPTGIGVSMPSTDQRHKKSILDKVYQKSGSNYRIGMFQDRRVKDLTQCASMLEYSVPAADNQPASRVDASMIDVQAWVKAELAANEHVDKLRRLAVEKRVGQGSKPSL